MAPPIIYYTTAPEEYQDVLGSEPYFLEGDPMPLEEIPLKGVKGEDGAEEEVLLTPEERDALTGRNEEGIPLGGLLLLYTMCLRELYESGETPSLNSKCQLLRPKRSQSRAKTPRRHRAKTVKRPTTA
jgi:hypothetical protein